MEGTPVLAVGPDGRRSGTFEALVPFEGLSENPDVQAARGALAALRYPRFRRYAAGVLFSLTGNWVEAAAFGYVVLLLGGAAGTLGVIVFLNTIPNLIWGLPAGALADRYGPRTLLLGLQGANIGVAVLLAVLWQTHLLTVPLLGAIALVGGSLGTLSFPAFSGHARVDHSQEPSRERGGDQRPAAAACAVSRAR